MREKLVKFGSDREHILHIVDIVQFINWSTIHNDSKCYKISSHMDACTFVV